MNSFKTQFSHCIKESTIALTFPSECRRKELIIQNHTPHGHCSQSVSSKVAAFQVLINLPRGSLSKRDIFCGSQILVEYEALSL